MTSMLNLPLKKRFEYMYISRYAPLLRKWNKAFKIRFDPVYDAVLFLIELKGIF